MTATPPPNETCLGGCGYESYNNLAHIQEKGWKFRFRIKDKGSNGILSGLDLPDTEEFDLPLHLSLTRRQDKLSGGFYKADTLTDFLEEVAQRCRFKYQFFGHYHTSRVIREKCVLLYEQIIRLKL